MATLPNGPMEVVFSFDTTGSMSQALDEVKARVNDIVQRLQADIVGFKVGVIAHGDYCDAHHFYDIKTLDLTNNLADVVTFVNSTDGTGGGDIPECYELALRRAREMSWTPGSKRVLVVIGDAYPHEPDYEMNKLNIDWKHELDSLVKMGVRVYGVQVENDPESTFFFTKLSKDSGGQHLKLTNMNTICQVIMGICYREHDVEMFHNYEKEVRAETHSHFGSDLVAVFGALRDKESASNDASSDDSTDTARKHNNLAGTSDDQDSSLPYKTVSSSKNVPNYKGAKTSSKNKSKIERIQQILKKGAKKTSSTIKTEPSSHEIGKPNSKRRRSKEKSESQIKARTELTTLKKTSKVTALEQKNISVAVGYKGTRKGQINKIHVKSSKNNTSRSDTRKRNRPRRESATSSDFKYGYLPWSKWHLAVSQVNPNRPGIWKNLAQRGCAAFWKKDLLNPLISRLETYSEATTVFEVGVQKQPNSKKEVVYFRGTNVCRSARFGILGLPWYSGMFRAARHLLSDSVNKGCNVFVRFAIVTKELKKKMPKEYDYSWLSQRQL